MTDSIALIPADIWLPQLFSTKTACEGGIVPARLTGLSGVPVSNANCDDAATMLLKMQGNM